MRSSAARRIAFRRIGIAGVLAAGGVLLGGLLGLVATRVAHSFATPAFDLGSRAACARYSGVPGLGDEAGMAFIAGGELEIGSTRGYPEERGGSRIRIESFWIDRTEVTNAQFARFVQATGYVTSAERAGAAPVFHKPTQAELEQNGNYAWWSLVQGASWRHPEGPSGDVTQHITQRSNHPVVQVTHDDALAYARWLGHRLPSEAQWEYAAKARRDSMALHREPRDARGKPLANFWQGDFPTVNAREDGFETSAPVGCFPANPFGLFDTLGNVWEWTGTSYTSSHDKDDAAHEHAASDDAACSASAQASHRLVLKGGSFLCSSNYCARYRVAARHAQEPGQPAMHIGFRTMR